MFTRRGFLGSITFPAAAAAVTYRLSLNSARAAAVLDDLSSHPHDPSTDAMNEDFWARVAQAYTTDRSLINLNNGGVSPAPAVVQDAMKRHLDYSNTAPAYTMWRVLEPQREAVRETLADTFDVEPDEIALTRNASEGLQICQFGMDLKAGDEVLTTTQDYPRMINTFLQRQRREGIVLKRFSIPTPAENPDEIVSLFEQNITGKTRVILVSHMVFLTGQILPVAQVAALGRKKGIPVIVDGAHALGHFAFTLSDVDCEYYGTSLHKWLCAPHGTGLLYVRKNKIPGLWPLMAADEKQDDDIRKFEEIGTHPAANYLAIAEALTFYRGIGAERKERRLRYLRDYWARRLLMHDRVRLHTSLKPGFSCAIATVQVDGIDQSELCDYLWKQHRILTVGIEHDEFSGLRVSPNVYTTLPELDRFCDVMEKVIRNGLPA